MFIKILASPPILNVNDFTKDNPFLTSINKLTSHYVINDNLFPTYIPINKQSHIMIGDDDNSSLLEAPCDFCGSGWNIRACIPGESNQFSWDMDGTDTHLYHIVHGQIFKSKLQAAKHFVSSKQLFTHVRTYVSTASVSFK